MLLENILKNKKGEQGKFIYDIAKPQGKFCFPVTFPEPYSTVTDLARFRG